MDKDYEILKQTDQGTLIQIEIDGKKHQTFAVCKRDNMEDANLDDVVEDFKQSIINPPTITPVDNSTEKASGKQKLLDLGLTEEEVKALIGV
jgi:enhancing lycopene biosynthesis protein 2